MTLEALKETLAGTTVTLEHDGKKASLDLSSEPAQPLAHVDIYRGTREKYGEWLRQIKNVHFSIGSLSFTMETFDEEGDPAGSIVRRGIPYNDDSLDAFMKVEQIFAKLSRVLGAVCMLPEDYIENYKVTCGSVMFTGRGGGRKVQFGGYAILDEGIHLPFKSIKLLANAVGDANPLLVVTEQIEQILEDLRILLIEITEEVAKELTTPFGADGGQLDLTSAAAQNALIHGNKADRDNLSNGALPAANMLDDLGEEE